MGEWLKRGKAWQLSISTRTNYFSLPTARDKATFCLYQTRLQVFRWSLLTHKLKTRYYARTNRNAKGACMGTTHD